MIYHLYKYFSFLLIKKIFLCVSQNELTRNWVIFKKKKMKIQYTCSWSILFEWNDILPYRVRIELRPVLKEIKLNAKRTM